MIKIGRLFALVAITLSAWMPLAHGLDPKTRNEMLRSLDSIHHMFETRYAPSEWKMKFAGWDLETEFALARRVILTANEFSQKDFQRLIKTLLMTTRDYHVQVSFYSTESANLPFQVKGVNGKYFITDIDPMLLDRTPLSVGDELISFDGRPIAEVIREIRYADVGSDNDESDMSMAEMFLTYRSGLKGDIVPQGNVTITVKSATKKLRTLTLKWNYTPERIRSGLYASVENEEFNQLPHIKNDKYMNYLCMHSLATDMGALKPGAPIEAQADEDDRPEHPNAFAARRSFVPVLGQKVWQTKRYDPFYAYIYINEDGKPVGYVRIPHYSMEAEECIQSFAQIIALMEEATSALVIDQVNNPGGNLLFLYGLLAMLSDQPLQTLKHRMMISQEDVAVALSLLDEFASIRSDEDLDGQTLYGYPFTYEVVEQIRNYYQFVIDEWNAGRYFTQPQFLLGISSLTPNPFVTYSKPILVLTNGLDFSCADLLPAILQDNKRATLFGTRTAGAGGYIDRRAFANRFGIAGVRLTGSIAERSNLAPIENLGVTPDIHYELTEEDIRYGYQGYVQALNEAVNSIIRD